MTVKSPLNEAAGLQCLRRYQILDTDPEQNFDDITRLAAQLCETPAAAITCAAITFLDGNRQGLKFRIGIDLAATCREVSLRAHTILGDDLLYVPHTPQNERLTDNPLVTGEPFVRFYGCAARDTGRMRHWRTVCGGHGAAGT